MILDGGMRILVTGHRGNLGVPIARHLASQLAAGVPVNDRARYQASPRRALIDCLTAETILGWRPGYHWAHRGSRI